MRLSRGLSVSAFASTCNLDETTYLEMEQRPWAVPLRQYKRILKLANASDQEKQALVDAFQTLPLLAASEVPENLVEIHEEKLNLYEKRKLGIPPAERQGCDF